MRKLYFYIILVLILASRTSVAGEIITAQEVDGYMYSDGEMKDSKPIFEITYQLEGDTITRTNVYDFKNKKHISDNTVYHIQRQLLSDPSKRMSISGKVVIRAIGQPGSNAVEILTIGEKYIQSVKSTSDYFIISRLKRIK